MRYYIYQIQFTDFEGKLCRVSFPNVCDPALFDENLLETKAIVFDLAKALNNDQEVTEYTFSITDIVEPVYDDLTNQ